MPEHLVWPVWRLVIEGVATKTEIERFWTVGDVLDANEALDIQQEADARAREAAEQNGAG